MCTLITAIPTCIVRSARTYCQKRNPKLLGVYTTLPYDVFRINSSAKVSLRDHDKQKQLGRTSYDLHMDSTGLVLPSPNSDLFERPNGMSVRPNGPVLQEIVRAFRSKNLVIYRLPQGLDLASKSLTLFWEHTDHHAIQTTVPIELDTLNKKLTKMCIEEGERMTKNEFLDKYPFESSY